MLVVNQDVPEDWLPYKDMSSEEFRKKFDPIGKQISNSLKNGSITPEQYREELKKIPPRGVYLEDFAGLKLEAKQSSRYYYDKLLKESKKGRGKCNKFLQSLLDNSMYSKMGKLGHNWKDFENLSEAEKKLLKSQLEYQLKEVSNQIKKSRGTVPDQIQQYLDALDKEEPA